MPRWRVKDHFDLVRGERIVAPLTEDPAVQGDTMTFSKYATAHLRHVRQSRYSPIPSYSSSLVLNSPGCLFSTCAPRADIELLPAVGADKCRP
jgi:hypothetical protein